MTCTELAPVNQDVGYYQELCVFWPHGIEIIAFSADNFFIFSLNHVYLWNLCIIWVVFGDIFGDILINFGILYILIKFS